MSTVIQAPLIAHQLPLARAEELGLPPGMVPHALPPGRAWEVPQAAEILVVVPPRGALAREVPAQKPPGWPGRLRWVHAVSAGVDEYPLWLFEVPQVTCGRGTSSAAIAEF